MSKEGLCHGDPPSCGGRAGGTHPTGMHSCFENVFSANLPHVFVVNIFQELMLKDEECKKLEHVRDQMCEELEELTAKLFEVFISFFW